MAEEVKSAEVTVQSKEGKGLSIAGMVLGICSIVLSVWFGFILGVLAIIFSAIGLKRKKNGIALAGLITGIAGTVLSIIFGVIIAIAIMLGIQENARETEVQSSAYTVQSQTEDFYTEKGAYPSFDEIQDSLDTSGSGIIIGKQGANSDADIIYIPCYGYGAVIWYWSSSYEEYQELYAGTTDECEWN